MATLRAPVEAELAAEEPLVLSRELDLLQRKRAEGEKHVVREAIPARESHPIVRGHAYEHRPRAPPEIRAERGVRNAPAGDPKALSRAQPTHISRVHPNGGAPAVGAERLVGGDRITQRARCDAHARAPAAAEIH